jgi:hypothetical protein
MTTKEPRLIAVDMPNDRTYIGTEVIDLAQKQGFLKLRDYIILPTGEIDYATRTLKFEITAGLMRSSHLETIAGEITPLSEEEVRHLKAEHPDIDTEEDVLNIEDIKPIERVNLRAVYETVRPKDGKRQVTIGTASAAVHYL